MRLVKQDSDEKNVAMEINNNDEAEVRQIVANWTKALRAKDVEGLMANYTPDVLFFDLAPPLQYKGADACRKNWEEWLPTFQGPLGCEQHELVIAAGSEEDVFYLTKPGRQRACRA